MNTIRDSSHVGEYNLQNQKDILTIDEKSIVDVYFTRPEYVEEVASSLH